MKTVWYKGLKDKEKEEAIASFQSSGYMRERLTAILNEKISTNRKSSLGVDKYNSPGWAYLQADAVGYQRALEEIISIVSNDNG